MFNLKSSCSEEISYLTLNGTSDMFTRNLIKIVEFMFKNIAIRSLLHDKKKICKLIAVAINKRIGKSLRIIIIGAPVGFHKGIIVSLISDETALSISPPIVSLMQRIQASESVFRNLKASSKQATAKRLTPLLYKIRLISHAPRPYASALTTAMISVLLFTSSCTFRRLCMIAEVFTSSQQREYKSFLFNLLYPC